MVETGMVKFRKEITAVANATTHIDGPFGYTYPDVQAGAAFPCDYTTPEKNYLCTRPDWRPTLLGGSVANFPNYLVIDLKGTLLGVAMGRALWIHSYEQPIADRFSYKENEVLLPGSLKKELLYNGKSGKTIKVTYREFVDSMARPAFYQNLEYDLAESRDIGFRDIRITVIEATNSFIRFVVK
jgi:hypothetical protein